MFKPFHFIIFSALLCCFTAQAETYNITPGALKAKIGNAKPTEVTLTGTADYTDLQLLAQLPEIKRIDLKGLKIVASNNPQMQNREDELPAMSLAACKAQEIILPASLTAIGTGALAQSEVISISIPGSVKSIADGAFALCPKLTTLTMPATVPEFGQGVATGCDKLSAVLWYASRIPAYAFSGCKNLKTVTASSVTQIDDAAFKSCKALQAFTFAPGLQSIGAEAFMQSGLEKVNLTNNTLLTSMGERAFAECDNLTQVSLPGYLKEIGQGAFFNNTQLTSITSPAGVMEIPDLAFVNVPAQADANGLIYDYVKTIGRYSMAGMTGVEQLKLPTSLEKIDSHAMQGMTSLQTIDARNIKNVPWLGEDVWKDVDQKQVYLQIHEDDEPQYMIADQWKEFKFHLSDVPTFEADVKGACNLKYHLQNDLLTVVCDQPLRQVMVYDMSGKMIATAAVDGTAEANMNIGASGTLIISVDLITGAHAAAKIAKP